ncbi:MAG: ABC transporter ATP-binding protein [Gammaproteobacteria bacterium]
MAGLRLPAGLRLNGVAKHFGDVAALTGLDLEIEPGEFVCLFGPSAAGKTTALRIIAGLERADEGSVHYAGVDLTDAPVQGRDMAMVFQTFALYPHLSVRDNLAYPLRQARADVATIGQRVDETAEMLRIEHTLDRKPDTLSGGEQQRLAIGRALVKRPGLLLLDEPLTNLDAKLRHDTRVEFKRLHRELGMTMLYATPDQLEALSMGQRIAMLRDGCVVQTDTPDAIYDRPGDTYVASMIGAPSMNLVPATVGGATGSLEIALPFSSVPAARWHESLSGGERVRFGIRPQDLAPARGGERPGFGAEVHLTEPLGDITVIDLDAAGTALRMVLPEAQAYRYKVGDRLDVELALEQAHLFYEETGIRVG